ncbi:hypothetical protein EDB80DRAFT_756405 [Ilyonectria destructans]|nr:hypothetical protein EDB80DRAFT_756405 [Ilyonectria destructans]
MATTDLRELNRQNESGPRLQRSFTLHFQGDWGMANFHCISVTNVSDGRVQLSISMPAQLLSTALTGQGIFKPYGPMPLLHALGVLPQDDRMVLAISPEYNIHSFDELRQLKPALRIATSHNDGTNFISYVASEIMKAYGVNDAELKLWGGEYIMGTRPEEAIALWESVIEQKGFIPLPAESTALARLAESNPGATRPDARPLPAGFWPLLKQLLPCLDFADFVVLVRNNLPEEVAYLLIWCLVETRASLEGQYHHLRPEKSPLTYPLKPKNMAQSPVPLHPGAYRYYKEAGCL